MIAELIIDTLATGGLTVAALKGFQHFRKGSTIGKLDKNGIMYWSWVDIPYECRGFQCPKCRDLYNNRTQPPCCSCHDYHKEHFHFKCNGCKFEAIMRTADDKDK